MTAPLRNCSRGGFSKDYNINICLWNDSDALVKPLIRIVYDDDTCLPCVMCRHWSDQWQCRVWSSSCGSLRFTDHVVSDRCWHNLHVAAAADRPTPQCCTATTASSSWDGLFTSTSSLLPSAYHHCRGSVQRPDWQNIIWSSYDKIYLRVIIRQC